MADSIGTILGIAIAVILVVILLKEMQSPITANEGYNLEKKQANLSMSSQWEEIKGYGTYIYKDNTYLGWLIFIVFVIIIGRVYVEYHRD